MKKLALTSKMRATIQRCIWFEKPEDISDNTARIAAYVLTHGMPEDVQVLREQLNDGDLKIVLDAAPPGIFDARSWAYWNLVVGRYETPPMPTRHFD